MNLYQKKTLLRIASEALIATILVLSISFPLALADTAQTVNSGATDLSVWSNYNPAGTPTATSDAQFGNMTYTGGTETSNIIKSTSALTLGGGTLNLIGSPSATNSQAFSSTAISSGGSSIRLTDGAGNAKVLQLGAISRSVGRTVDFTLPSRTQSACGSHLPFFWSSGRRNLLRFA